MKMFPRFNTFRRNRWRDQVIENGRALRALEVARAQVYLTGADVEALDAEIEYRTRRRDALLAKIKETADVPE